MYQIKFLALSCALGPIAITFFFLVFALILFIFYFLVGRVEDQSLVFTLIFSNGLKEVSHGCSSSLNPFASVKLMHK